MKPENFQEIPNAKLFEALEVTEQRMRTTLIGLIGKLDHIHRIICELDMRFNKEPSE